MEGLERCGDGWLASKYFAAERGISLLYSGDFWYG
jgi:hypothetical protein